MPSDGARRALADIRWWERKHPGHCGRCGLPFDYCYHADTNFLEEIRRVGHHPRDRGPVVQEWQAAVLKRIPTEILKGLPRPRQVSKLAALVEELNKRKRLGEIPETYLTRWQILMGTDLV